MWSRQIARPYRVEMRSIFTDIAEGLAICLRSSTLILIPNHTKCIEIMEFQDELEQEISDLLRNPPDSWLIFPPNLKKSTYLRALVIGPADSSYENEPLLVKIYLPSHWFDIPECEFVTPIQSPFVRFRQRRHGLGLAVSEGGQMANFMHFPTISTDIRNLHIIRKVLNLVSQQLAAFGKEIKSGFLLRRIKRDLEEIDENPPANCSLRQLNEGNYYNFIATVIGPKGSWYENGIFTVEIDLPRTYPFSSPIDHFITPIYHPNIDENGSFYRMHLQAGWRAANTLRDFMTSIVNLLTRPYLECVHQGDEALRLLRNDKQRYIAKARKWTHKFASKG